MLALLLGNGRLIGIAIAALVVFWGGWHSHTVYDGYKRDKEEVKVIKKLGEGQNGIIRFNSALDKAIKTSSDDCLNHSVPTAIRLLLTGGKSMP